MLVIHMFHSFDLLGTFVFAISGAIAGIKSKLDIFGITVVAFITACGGGIVRDIILGVHPAAGLINHQYLYLVVLAVFLSIFFEGALNNLSKAILFFDALGLGFFAAFGVHKSYELYQNIELSLILGCVSAVGGGVLRDLLLREVPVILKKEIYASCALIGAIIQLSGDLGFMQVEYSSLLAIIVCTIIRLVSIRYKINLPSINRS